MFQCPISGGLCLLQKSVPIKFSGGQVNVCSGCTAQTIIWSNFLNNVLHSLQIDKILPPEEFRKAVESIKSMDELNEFLRILQERKRKIAETPPCPSCGINVQMVAQSGRLGCPECYKHFDEFVRIMLLRTHGDDKHVGKTPSSALSGAMKKAVKEERYEDAAKIRDKIKALGIDKA